MILKCALVDDEPLALQLLETYVKRTPFLLLHGKYSSAVKAMEGIKEFITKTRGSISELIKLTIPQLLSQSQKYNPKYV